MSGPVPLVIERGARTPCCDRVPVVANGGRFVCTGCGTVYVSVRSIIEKVFGPCADA